MSAMEIHLSCWFHWQVHLSSVSFTCQVSVEKKNIEKEFDSWRKECPCSVPDGVTQCCAVFSPTVVYFCAVDGGFGLTCGQKKRTLEGGWLSEAKKEVDEDEEDEG